MEFSLPQTDLLSRVSGPMLRRALEMAGMGVWQRDLRTDHCIRSPGIDVMFGFARGEAGDHAAPFHDRIHPDDRDLMCREVARAVPGELLSQEFRVIHPDGSIRWLAGRGEMPSRPPTYSSVLTGVTSSGSRPLSRNTSLASSAHEVATPAPCTL